MKLEERKFRLRQNTLIRTGAVDLVPAGSRSRMG